MTAAGATLVGGEGVICQESPDEMYELMSIQSKNMAR